MIPQLPSRVKRNFGGRAFFCISFPFQGRASGVEGLETYEKYEYIAGLGAVVELGVAIKVPAFRTAFPFALLPMTLCAGIAAYLHSKLPKDKKWSLFRRGHPANLFVGILLMNIMFFLDDFF